MCLEVCCLRKAYSKRIGEEETGSNAPFPLPRGEEEEGRGVGQDKASSSKMVKLLGANGTGTGRASESDLASSDMASKNSVSSSTENHRLSRDVNSLVISSSSPSSACGCTRKEELAMARGASSISEAPWLCSSCCVSCTGSCSSKMFSVLRVLLQMDGDPTSPHEKMAGEVMPAMLMGDDEMLC